MTACRQPGVIFGVNLVKDAAVSKVHLGHVGPVHKGFFNREQIELGESAGVFGLGFFRGGAIEVFANNVLRFFRVQVFQVGRRHRAGAFFVHIFVNHVHGRFGQNADGRHHNFNPVTKLFFQQIGLVFPTDEGIALVALRKGDGRPARAASGFWVGHDHADAGFDQVIPVLDALGVAFAHHQHDGRGVRRRVVRQALLPVFGNPVAVVVQGIGVAGQGNRGHGANSEGSMTKLELLNSHFLITKSSLLCQSGVLVVLRSIS